MRKIYEKPTLVKREALGQITAVLIKNITLLGGEIID